MPKRVKVKLLERPRNRLVLEAIALKAGVHGRSDKAVRRDERQEARKAGREAWASRGERYSCVHSPFQASAT